MARKYEIGLPPVVAVRVVDVDAAGKSHSRVILPSDGVSGEPADVQAIVAAAHTPEVIANYLAFVAERDQGGA